MYLTPKEQLDLQMDKYNFLPKQPDSWAIKEGKEVLANRKSQKWSIKRPTSMHSIL